MAKGKTQPKQKPLIIRPAATPKSKPVIAHIREAIPTKWKLLIAAALAVLAMGVYAPSHHYDYVYDDDAVIKENKFVQQGLGGLGKIWTTSYFQGYQENMIARAYRPIPLTTLAIETEFFGLKPGVNHKFNILYYGLIGFFLFLFLAKLLRNQAPVLPVFVSLVFLLHPIHLEVIANIKSRDTMLGFLGAVLAGFFLLKHLDNRKILPLALSLMFFFFGLFSKEEVITWVAVIPLMLWFFRDYSWKRIALVTLPFLGAALVFLLVRSSILGGLNEGVKLTYFDNSLLAAKTGGERIASNIFVLGHYLLKTVFPHPLLSDYSYSTLPLVGFGDWRVWAALLANLALLGLGMHGLVRRRWHGFGALNYFCTVSIFTSILTPNVSAYNDRFLFSPVLGICMILGWALLAFGKKQAASEPFSWKGLFTSQPAMWAAMALIAALSVFKIQDHLPVWKDRFVLFESEAKIAPNNARIRKNNGGSYARLAVDQQKSDPQAARQYAEQAITELKAALAIYDYQSTGYIHLGNMHLIRGEYDLAEEALRNALRLENGNYFARSSLGNLLYRTTRYAEAAQMLEGIPPQLRRAGDYNVLALVYEQLGDAGKAAEYRRLGGN